MFQRGTKPQSTSQTKRYRHYVHSPFVLEHQGVKVDVDENGKIIISQEHEDDGKKETDEIHCSASLINRIARMLMASRKVVWKDEPFKGDEEEEENGVH